MSSRSSNSSTERLLPIGRVAGHRGNTGELTVRVASGEADRWTALRRVSIAPPGGQAGSQFEVERSRAYRDRLVLKLQHVDDPGAAEHLRGQVVWAPRDQVPPLPEGVHYQARLINLEVFDLDGVRLGRVTDVIATGGADLLAVEDDRGGEILIPLAREVIREVDEERGRIEVRLPDGLRELNRSEEDRR